MRIVSTCTLGLLLACDAPCPVAAPEVTGGTELQRRVVSGVVETFESWVGPGRTCTHEVRLVDEPLEDGALGRFLPIERVAEVQRSHREPTLASTTVHELCHGLDLGEWVSPDDAARWEPLVRRGRDTHPSLLPLEGFAQLCELGPVTLAALASCPRSWGHGDPRAEARWILDEIFVEARPTPWPMVEEGSWRLAAPADTLFVDEGEDGRPRVVVVREEADGTRVGWSVPLDLGRVLHPDPRWDDHVVRGAAGYHAHQPSTFRPRRAAFALGQAVVVDVMGLTAGGASLTVGAVQTAQAAFHLEGVCGDAYLGEDLVDVDGLPRLVPVTRDVVVASTDRGTFVLTVHGDRLTWRRLADAQLAVAPWAGRSPGAR